VLLIFNLVGGRSPYAVLIVIIVAALLLTSMYRSAYL